jgi:hypothetical protein
MCAYEKYEEMDVVMTDYTKPLNFVNKAVSVTRRFET